MKSIEQIAAAMYAAYRKSMQCQCPTTGAIWGTPCVPWEQLDVDRRDAWIAATHQAIAEISTVF